MISAWFLAVGCTTAGTGKPGIENADDKVGYIGVTWRSPWPGNILFEEERPPELFTEKLPVNVIFIRSSQGWSGGLSGRSRCDIDTDEFEPQIVKTLESWGADVRHREPAPLTLSVFVSLIDAPRGASEVPEFCYMTVWTRLEAQSRQVVSWAPDKEFTADVEFYENSNVYRLQPEQMREEFESHIDFDVRVIAPLLLGKAGGKEPEAH
ncbi:MAG: hypothetical protein ACLFWF_10380 [Alphaproteobacteria bacterium]